MIIPAEEWDSVVKSSWNLRFVKKQCHEICMLAVKKDGHSIKFVENQTEELCRAALAEDEWSDTFFHPEVKKSNWYRGWILENKINNI